MVKLKNYGSNIVAGAGYSSDTQQIASQVCFNGNIDSTSGESSYIELDTAMSFEDLQSSVKVDVTTTGKFGMFSASAEASYMQETEDKYYSLSLNYYQYAEQKVSISTPYGKTLSLNKLGHTYYQNGTNPYFGLDCGDNYIDWYQQGAMLIMGLNINFASEYEKTQFDEQAGASFADIVSASEEVQTTSSKYYISGTVSIQAFQMGGDPSQLAYILKPDNNGEYYALSCGLQDMNSCVQAASGLLDYARNNFTTQFSFKDNTGLTALGIGFAHYEPISQLGLEIPQSFVTDQVILDREFLGNSLKENQYYEQKSYSLVYGYQAPWNESSTLFKESQNLFNRVQNNIKILMSPDNPEQGGLGCYDLPDQCDSITEQIRFKLNPITQNDLGFLSELEYCYTLFAGANSYRMGDSPITSWNTLVPSPPDSSGSHVLDVRSISITPTYYFFNIDVIDYRSNQCHLKTQGSGLTSTDGGMIYSGDVDNWWSGGHDVQSSAQYKLISPFYFEVYNGSNADDFQFI